MYNTGIRDMRGVRKGYKRVQEGTMGTRGFKRVQSRHSRSISYTPDLSL